jgi:regulatory protein
MAPPAPPRKAPRPLDEAALRELALRYLSRFATSRAKLAAYLGRKIGERGWTGDRQPDVPALVERMADLGYIDDAAFGSQKAGALLRRGYGRRRVEQALQIAGIADADRGDARARADESRWQAAEALARRRRIGPFATTQADRPTREKQFAAFLRAGHDMTTARAWVNAAPGEVPEED